ncbi:TMEM14 family protein [Phormidesmis priestleyi]
MTQTVGYVDNGLIWVGLIVIYGLLVAIGGLIGYAKAKSKVSLISGLVSGLVLVIAAYMTSNGSPNGLTLATIVAVILLIVFSIRWSKTKALMPSGLMAILSLCAAIAFGIGKFLNS